MNHSSLTKQKAFTLLYSLIISSLILATVLSIVNIALKQSNITGLGKRSQVAFYAANSGMECALYWALNQRKIVTTLGEIEIPIFKIPRDDNADAIFGSQYDSPLIDNDDNTISIRTDTDTIVPSINCFDNNIVQNAAAYAFDTQYDFPDIGWFDAIQGDQVESVTGLGATLEQLCGEGFVKPSSIPEKDYRVWLFRVIMPQGGILEAQENPCAEVAVCRRLDSAQMSISSRGYNTCDINSDQVVERAVRLIQL
jgi:hypothetical protein